MRSSAALLISLAVFAPLATTSGAAEYSLPEAGPVPALSQEEQNNIDIYEKAGPGVVHITSVAVAWDYFYNVVPRAGTGSGLVIDERGHILTNFHVIQDSQRLWVTLSDNSKWRARVVGVDPATDLAVIRIEAPRERLKPIPLGTSKGLRVGQKILAIGNPFGLERTLTTGIISSLGRSLRAEDGRVIQDLIQSDAAINPGNSGGPLLNSAGQAIGVNTAIFSPSGGSIGIGFSVPIDHARRILPDLVNTGKVRHSYLGVHLFGLTPDLAQHLGLPVQKGAVVATVVAGSPAHRYGLRGGTQQVALGNVVVAIGGDVITAVDGQAVEGSEELIRLLAGHRPGDRVTLDVVRPDLYRNTSRQMSIQVTLGDAPQED